MYDKFSLHVVHSLLRLLRVSVSSMHFCPFRSKGIGDCDVQNVVGHLQLRIFFLHACICECSSIKVARFPVFSRSINMESKLIEFFVFVKF